MGGLSRIAPPWCIVFACVCFTGCGYPGDPLPPALNRPDRVIDLSAVERGEKIVIHFTVPAKTTEGLPIKQSPEFELRIGPASPTNFQLAAWAQGADRVPSAAIQEEGRSVTAQLPASKYYGQALVVGVRVHGPGGRDAGWSNLESLTVVPALAAPEDLGAKNAPDAVVLEWRATAPEFRVFRKLAEEKDWALLGTSPKASYTDSTIDYGKSYSYFVQAVEKAGDRYAESEISKEIAFTPVDHFAPVTPVNVMAVPGTRTIELVWERNTEKDLAGYRVYRDGMKVSDGQAAPAYSDKDVKPGTRYRYEVSAVDLAGNESARSAPVEAAIP